jgi:polyferredoxin/ferredoxin
MRIPLGGKRSLTTRGIRRFVQLAFFALFVALFVGTVNGFPILSRVPSDLFLRTSPLIALASVAASRSAVWTVVLPAGIVVMLTLLLGRVYCGWFCPFGTLIDIAERTVFRGKWLARSKQAGTWPEGRSDRWRPVKYVLLACALGAALFSYQPLLFLDPISMLHRSATVAVGAPAETAGKDIAALLYRPLAKRGIRISPAGERRLAHGGFIVAAMLVAVLGLSGIQRRFWCRYLCPLGAVLGLFSWVPLLRRKAADSCVHCHVCEKLCKMGCIGGDGMTYRSRECIACYECEVCCPVGAVTFPIAHDIDATASQMDRRHQLTRRRLLTGLAAGAGWYLTMKASPAGRLVGPYDRWKNPDLLRPPGALPERQFLDLCTRCGECVKVCPTNTLQPAAFEAGPEGTFTPVVVPRIGECAEQCNACGLVCPTGAIQPFMPEQKNPRVTSRPLIIGMATIDRNRCRPWYTNEMCSVCDEQCPYDAIASPVVDGLKRPFVMESLCTGCGACERECPIEPEAAIRVSSRDEQRPVLKLSRGVRDGFRRPSADANIDPGYLPERDAERALDLWARTTGRDNGSQPE